METTITISSIQENDSFTIIIEIPTTNIQHTVHQPPVDQLPAYRNETEIKSENIEAENEIVHIKEEPIDYDPEMNLVPLNEISMISDDKYSPMSPDEFDESSTDFESDDDSSNISCQDYFDRINDMIEYLEQNICNQSTI